MFNIIKKLSNVIANYKEEKLSSLEKDYNEREARLSLHNKKNNKQHDISDYETIVIELNPHNKSSIHEFMLMEIKKEDTLNQVI